MQPFRAADALARSRSEVALTLQWAPAIPAPVESGAHQGEFEMTISESCIRITKRAAAFASLALLAFVAVGEPDAQASGAWQVTDGFENSEDPADVWHFEHVGIGSGGFDLNSAVAHRVQ